MMLMLPDHKIWEGWVTLGLVGVMLVALVGELAPPYLVMMGTLIIFLPLDILDIEEAFHGFADEAMLSVAVLFVVAKGIEQSGGLEYVSKVLFSTKKKVLKPGEVPSKSANSIVWVLLKFCIPVGLFSAFLANIPLVAMMIPPIVEFGTKVNMAPSKMLIPLSYAAQLGGTLTLIGATTNLVVLSLASKKVPTLKMNLFEIGMLGMPVLVAGLFYIFAVSGKLLPDRLVIQQTTINAREYNVVLVVKPKSSLVGKTIEQSGATHQPGLHLLQVVRDGNRITTPPADFIIQAKDHLQFSGVIDSVLSLTRFDGLALSEDEGQEQVDLNRLKVTQCLVEAVVALGSPLVQKKVSELQFRARYKAAIVAIHRHGKRLDSAIGDIVLQAGDSLLMVADGSEFVSKHRNNSIFSLVAKLPGFVPVQRRKAGIAALLVLGMIVGSGVGFRLITSALFSAAGLLAFGCLTAADAMDSIELPVLIMISAAFGISEAMVVSGAADIVAKALMGAAGKSMFGLITCTYVATTVFSLAITNGAAVTIMFPVALAAAQSQQLDFRPFAYTLMMASSAGFMTPTGCPTNLMVYQPGGYKFLDFIVYGGPLQLVLGFVTVGLTMTLRWWWAWWLAIFVISIVLTPFLAQASYNIPKPSTGTHEDHAHQAESGENSSSNMHDETRDTNILHNTINSSTFELSAMVQQQQQQQSSLTITKDHFVDVPISKEHFVDLPMSNDSKTDLSSARSGHDSHREGYSPFMVENDIKPLFNDTKVQESPAAYGSKGLGVSYSNASLLPSNFDESVKLGFFTQPSVDSALMPILNAKPSYTDTIGYSSLRLQSSSMPSSNTNPAFMNVLESPNFMNNIENNEAKSQSTPMSTSNMNPSFVSNSEEPSFIDVLENNDKIAKATSMSSTPIRPVSMNTLENSMTPYSNYEVSTSSKLGLESMSSVDLEPSNVMTGIPVSLSPPSDLQTTSYENGVHDNEKGHDENHNTTSYGNFGRTSKMFVNDYSCDPSTFTDV